MRGFPLKIAVMLATAPSKGTDQQNGATVDHSTKSLPALVCPQRRFQEGDFVTLLRMSETQTKGVEPFDEPNLQTARIIQGALVTKGCDFTGKLISLCLQVPSLAEEPLLLTVLLRLFLSSS